MSAPEFSRLVKLDRLPAAPITLTANDDECRRLAGRFALPSLARLEAVLTLTAEGEVIEARGRLWASFEQSCALAGNPFPNALDEPLALRFVPALALLAEDEEHEFGADEPDEIEYSGNAIDLGEAVAQSFGLAIDPYATGPDAETARKEAGLGEGSGSGAFAALAALKPPKP
ncbi:YceD family protein [Qipengyuania sediminis]|uniref:YceD family protein n=1 Tax=Qipengyuania sediminis TaxID=1532023 RepID=UPI001059A062|nr:DUF177 domain-containing protein [Qipengyuania sediminis]